MFKHSGTRLSAALLGYFTLVILLLTLNPFQLAIPERIEFTLRSSSTNLISNIVLFLPIGFLYHLTTQRRGAFVLGFALSLGVEIVQLFIPARTPSIIDILANTLGAGLGALVHIQVAARLAISRGMVGRLRLETPLMGLMYLVGPLLWAHTLASRFSSERWALTALILLCVALVFSQLFRHWWEHVTARIAFFAALATGLWSLIGLGPLLLFSTRIQVISAGMMALTYFLTQLPPRAKERRFEQATLRQVLPIFFLFLLGLATWPPFRPLTAWHATSSLTTLPETNLQALLPRIEYLIAFTVLGYLLAEWRGRAELALQQDLPRVCLTALGFAALLEFLVGFQTGPGACLLRTGLAVTAALFGGTIYHLLRAHIRFLLGR